MKFEIVQYWDRTYIIPTISIVTDISFTGYKYLTLSFLKRGLEISWSHTNADYI